MCIRDSLPLGHAAENEIFIPNSNRISQDEQNLLFLCNGHGEDTIACKVIKALHEINPDISHEVLPIVGDGKAFSTLVKDGWLAKIGPSTFLPSGGFSNQSLSGLVLDLKAGLLIKLWKQWTLIHKSASEGRIIVAVGDFLPLLFAWASGCLLYTSPSPRDS